VGLELSLSTIIAPNPQRSLELILVNVLTLHTNVVLHTNMVLHTNHHINQQQKIAKIVITPLRAFVFVQKNYLQSVNVIGKACLR